MTRQRKNPSQEAIRKRCEALAEVQSQLRSAAPQKYYEVVDYVMRNEPLARIVWGDGLDRIKENILDSSPYTENQLDRALPLLYSQLSKPTIVLNIWDLLAADVRVKQTPASQIQNLLLAWALRSLNRRGIDPNKGEIVSFTPTPRETPNIVPTAMEPIGVGDTLVQTYLVGLYFDKSNEIVRKAIVEAN